MASFKNQFSQYLTILRETLNGECQLDEEYPVIFNKVVRFCQKSGYDLYGTEEDIYEEVLTFLEEELG